MDTPSLANAPLGKTSTYLNTYTPSLLFPVPRQLKRTEIGITNTLPFTGVDIWNSYELSGLNPKGKPWVATAEFWFPCETPKIIESKSFKLYLNSFNNSRFESLTQVQDILERDLSNCVESPIQVKLSTPEETPATFASLEGTCLDHLDIECCQFLPAPEVLQIEEDKIVEETVFTHLLKSNCLVTGQPDWGSLEITYHGPKLSHEGLLKYIVSLRDHNEFHEQCIERIFYDLNQLCHPQWLSVYARYTRRGGLDINPYRVSPGFQRTPKNLRMIRQ